MDIQQGPILSMHLAFSTRDCVPRESLSHCMLCLAGLTNREAPDMGHVCVIDRSGAGHHLLCSVWALALCSGAADEVSVLLQAYGMHFADANGRPYMSSGGRIPKGAPILVGSTEEIEELRPKSPPPGGDRNQS